MNNNGKLIKVNFRRNRNNKLLQCSLTDNQKYELAIIELVYKIKPCKYDQICNFKSGEEFIKKHKAYIDENIVIEKYLDDKSKTNPDFIPTSKNNKDIDISDVFDDEYE